MQINKCKKGAWKDYDRLNTFREKWKWTSMASQICLYCTKDRLTLCCDLKLLHFNSRKRHNNIRRNNDMSRKSLLYLTFVLLVGMVTLWGCPKKAEVTTTPEAQPQAEKMMPPATPAEAAPAEMKPEVKAESPNEQAATMAEGLKPIYFDFDKSFIRDDSKTVMAANAEWLKANPKTKIKIEGNCDERGTKEYNQALGQRRAANAKKYLTEMGIAGHRISLISYGKEKPVCTEHDETCWQKNRRDDFVVTGN
jgi:peptidoglycan-associated lipoprotein